MNFNRSHQKPAGPPNSNNKLFSLQKPGARMPPSSEKLGSPFGHFKPNDDWDLGTHNTSYDPNECDVD